MTRRVRNIRVRGCRPATVGGSALRAGVVAAVSVCAVVAVTSHFKTGSRCTLQAAVARLSGQALLTVDFAVPAAAVTASAMALTRIDARRPAVAPAVIRILQTRLVVLSRMGGRHGP